ILAYPYPGRSAKISSGRGFPGHRISKKLMLRVRPGVELVRASLLPTRELITLDFPTFERPRNAISGTDGTGNWDTSVAAAINRERTLMPKFATEIEKMASSHPPIPWVSPGEPKQGSRMVRDSLRGFPYAVRLGQPIPQTSRVATAPLGCPGRPQWSQFPPDSMRRAIMLNPVPVKNTNPRT